MDQDAFEKPEGMSDEAVKMLFDAKKRESRPNWQIVAGRTVGVLLYLSLFQISTNGIRFCYDNEEQIRKIFPYGVPLLVTAMRILVLPPPRTKLVIKRMTHIHYWKF